LAPARVCSCCKLYVDPTTANILDALSYPRSAFLLALVDDELQESELNEAAPDVSTASVNRHMRHLARIGLVEQETGTKHSPGRKWRLSFPTETRTLLTAGLDFAAAVTARDAARREADRRRLRRAEAKSRLRDVSA
jgi:DNA-binding HxlR family transcriptional regulator